MRGAIELSRRVLRIAAEICLIANYSLAVASSSLRSSAYPSLTFHSPTVRFSVGAFASINY